jgi:photosystem II stability/assembly factor-like uncharacterized protein
MKSVKPGQAFLAGLLGTLTWLSAFPAEAGENLWTSHGPPGPVHLLAAAPIDPRTIYAAGTVNADPGPSYFKSSDGGESWDALSPGDLTHSQANCLAVDPTDPDAVYSGIVNFSAGNTYRFLSTRDGGAQWHNQALPSGVWPYAIAVDEGSGAIYVGTSGIFEGPNDPAPVLKSTDGGATWNNTSLAKPRAAYALLADALNETLLVGTNFSYTPTWYGYAYGSGGNVARTQDGGASWALSPTDLGSAVLSLAKGAQGSVYYAGTEVGALYRSFDGGANWSPVATLPGTVAALAVDPTDSSVLYAATPNRGVLRSTDSGFNWRSFNEGMASRYVTALTLDATGHVLHVATDQGVFDLAIAPEPQPSPCAPADDHLCFFGSRFRVDLTAIDPFTKGAFAAHAVPGNAQSGYFTFPSLTGDATFPEVMVKMVDATSLPGGGYWVFYAGMTSVLYTLEITDTTTGLSRQYSGEDSCGGAEVNGFLPGASATAGTSTRASLSAAGLASEPDLQLLNGRFRVTLLARNPATDTVAPGQAIPEDNRFGAFSLPAFTGNPELPEVFVKMLDAGGGSFLFFYTGLTTLDYAVTVVDTVTETEHTYSSEDGDPRRPCGAGELLMFPQ